MCIFCKYLFIPDRLSERSSLLIFNVQEDYDTSDVIDHILLFLPLFEGCSDQVLSCSLRVPLQEVRVDDVCNLLVLKELPDAIGSKDNDLVLGCHSKL